MSQKMFKQLSLATALILTVSLKFARPTAAQTYSSSLPVPPATTTVVTPATPVPTPIPTPTPTPTPMPVVVATPVPTPVATPVPAQSTLPVTAGGNYWSLALLGVGIATCIFAGYRLQLKS